MQENENEITVFRREFYSSSSAGIKVAPYSFSAREEWELNWHKRAREERDSPSQMTRANQPPRRTFPKSD